MVGPVRRDELKTDRYEIRLSGAGGQGIITAGMILAEAAGIHEGKFVCQTQSYGPEARGGASKTEIVLSSREIDYPKATQPDVLLAMNQKSCDTYSFDLKPSALLIVDSTFVRQLPTSRALGIPFTRLARSRLGSEVYASVIALGALVTISGVVSLKSIEAAVLGRAPHGTGEINRKALHLGVGEAKKVLKQREGEEVHENSTDE